MQRVTGLLVLCSVILLAAATLGCQQGARSRTREGSATAQAGSGVGSSVASTGRNPSGASVGSTALLDGGALPQVALRNWKLHVERFAARDAAAPSKDAARIADYSFATSIGGNFAWREHGVDYGRWKLSDDQAQQIRDVVASSEFVALHDQPDDGGSRLQITLAWPGGQRVATVASWLPPAPGVPANPTTPTLAADLQRFADDAVAHYRKMLVADQAQRGWTLTVSGPFIAARETVTLTGAGALSVQGTPKSSKAVVAASTVAPELLGRIAHLMSLPTVRALPRRVAAQTTVPIHLRLQLDAPSPVVVEVDSALSPENAELRELWDAVAAARRAMALR